MGIAVAEAVFHQQSFGTGVGVVEVVVQGTIDVCQAPADRIEEEGAGCRTVGNCVRGPVIAGNVLTVRIAKVNARSLVRGRSYVNLARIESHSTAVAAEPVKVANYSSVAVTTVLAEDLDVRILPSAAWYYRVRLPLVIALRRGYSDAREL